MARDSSWIKVQRISGKKDVEIVDDMKRKGWSEADAHKAIAHEDSPAIHERVTAAEKGVFLASLAGIFVLLWNLLSHDLLMRIDMGWPPQFNAPAIALALTGSLCILAWALYVVAVRHNHPKLHKMFFLFVGDIVGAGVVAWLLILTVTILKDGSVVLTTPAILIGVSLLFTVDIIALELVYARLRREFDGTPRKRWWRFAAAGLLVLLISLAALCAGSFYAMKFVSQQLHQQYDSSLQSLTQQIPPDVEQSLSLMPNPVLRDRFTADWKAYSSAKGKSMPELTFSSFWHDEFAGQICGALAGGYAAVNLAVDADLAGKYAQFRATAPAAKPDLALYDSIVVPKATQGRLDPPYGLRFKLVEDTQACISDVVAQASPYHGLPHDPDLSDPAQAEMVRFVVWNEQRK